MLKGGRGDDLLIGGPGDDTFSGGRGNDMIILGDADTDSSSFARGGAGNDVLVQIGGRADIRTGAGNDWIIIESFASTAGGSPNVQTRIRDFSPDDILVISGWDRPLPTDLPEDATLADMENGTADAFQWRETRRGVVIEAGDARIDLRGVDADQIDIDQILFAQASAQEALTLFDGGGDGGLLGTGAGGGQVYVEHVPSGESFITFGTATSTFDVWGGDLLDFSSTASGSPNI